MWLRLPVTLLGFAIVASAQNTPQRPMMSQPPLEEFLTNRPSNSPTSLRGDEYRIGRDDLIDVNVFGAPELASAGRVSANGAISLPLIGIVEATGKTTQELERAIEDVLRSKYLNDPHVTAFVREYASQPVSIVGAVKMPGIYQIKGQKFLLDMLATAQGVDQTIAGRTIQVIRRQPGSDEAQAIDIDVQDLFEKGKTELNIPVQAGDVINVLQAGSIFVVGEVARPGEFPLRQGKNVTAGQAIALSSGLNRDARKNACKIIRIHADGSKEEIPVDVGKIFEGSLNDVTLLPNDILFVPSNRLKTGLMKTLDSTINVVSGRLIYRF